MQLNYALFADSVTISNEGKFSVINVFRYIRAAKFPVTHPSMYWTVSVTAEKTEFDGQNPPTLEVYVIDPQGREMLRSKLTDPQPSPDNAYVKKFALPPEHVANIKIEGFEFPFPGTYHFRMDVNGEPMASTYLLLVEDVEMRASENQ